MQISQVTRSTSTKTINRVLINTRRLTSVSFILLSSVILLVLVKMVPFTFDDPSHQRTDIYPI